MRLSWILRLPALLLFLSSSPSNAAPSPPLIIEHGPRNSTKIALTFDACRTGKPDEYDAQVVDILLREKAPATLFLSGRWVEKNAEKARFLSTQEQFEIANHSYYHPHLTEATDERVTRELRRTQNILRKVTGKTARYFRPPYG